MTLFEELKRRGLIAQMTHEDKIKNILENEKINFYIGFDATADSLHVGHFLQLTVMKRFQIAGHTPIALLGTGTTMIGDPTGKTDMRKMLTLEEINLNAERFKNQMSNFLDFSDEKALLLKNGDWLLDLNYINFLRSVGRHFSVNKMLTAESVKARLEKGLSFLEFNYMLMQSYDFLHLYERHNCKMQLGGDDQWSNILGGIDLVRRAHSDEVYGMTFKLLTTKEGKKMGKTENGALWLDSEKVSPYDFYQYWRNIDDADVINCMKLLTFIPIEEIEEMENLEGNELNKVKERLGFELTKMVHGQEEAERALNTAASLFGEKNNLEDMPSTVLSKNDFLGGSCGLLDLLVKTGLCASKAEGRRLVTQGGILLDNIKVENAALMLTEANFEKGYIIIKKGKKVFHKVKFGSENLLV